jgi:hypothetical protein
VAVHSKHGGQPRATKQNGEQALEVSKMMACTLQEKAASGVWQALGVHTSAVPMERV